MLGSSGRVGKFALALGLLSACRQTRPIPQLPQIMLWAWERPEDLRYLNTSNAGIAFLARTVALENGHAILNPRLQPLQFPPGTALMAVVRLESNQTKLPTVKSATAQILPVTRDPHVLALQIDFDARRSERDWYRALLQSVHQQIKIPLSITALTSWCQGDPWIRDLPVAEAVPMLFRMGAGGAWNGQDFSVPLCRSSLGLATDELPALTPHDRRLYFFHPRQWTPAAYQGIIGEARRRQ